MQCTMVLSLQFSFLLSTLNISTIVDVVNCEHCRHMIRLQHDLVQKHNIMIEHEL